MAIRFLRWLSRAGYTLASPMVSGGEYVRPRRGDAAKDWVRLSGDMRAVGQDLRRTAEAELQRRLG